ATLPSGGADRRSRSVPHGDGNDLGLVGRDKAMTEPVPVSERIEHEIPRARTNSSTLWVGLAVLIFGAVMLLRNLDLDLDAVGMGFLGTFSWWPLFMLIPAAITLKNAYDAYQADGRQLTRSTRTQFATGIVIV